MRLLSASAGAVAATSDKACWSSHRCWRTSGANSSTKGANKWRLLRFVMAGRTRHDDGRTPVYTGTNIGIGGPPSLGTNFSFTSWPIFSAERSQSTKLVIIDGPSSNVTYPIAYGVSARVITL